MDPFDYLNFNKWAATLSASNYLWIYIRWSFSLCFMIRQITTWQYQMCLMWGTSVWEWHVSPSEPCNREDHVVCEHLIRVCFRVEKWLIAIIKLIKQAIDSLHALLGFGIRELLVIDAPNFILNSSTFFPFVLFFHCLRWRTPSHQPHVPTFFLFISTYILGKIS